MQLKTFKLELNFSSISYKAPNLNSLFCSEVNISSITSKTLLQNERGSYKFMFSLKTYFLLERDLTTLEIIT